MRMFTGGIVYWEFIFPWCQVFGPVCWESVVGCSQRSFLSAAAPEFIRNASGCHSELLACHLDVFQLECWVQKCN
jgi:hypothetical protein